MNRHIEILLSLNITPNYKGFHYLLSCMQYMQEDPTCLTAVTKELYPKVALEWETSPGCVERNLRTVIERSYKREHFLSLAGISLMQCPSNSMFLGMLSSLLYIETDRLSS